VPCLEGGATQQSGPSVALNDEERTSAGRRSGPPYQRTHVERKQAFSRNLEEGSIRLSADSTLMRADRLESGSKMPQERSLIGQPQPLNLFPVPPDFPNHFHNVIDMRLCVDAPRNRKP
jgi:hypothetical protein